MIKAVAPPTPQPPPPPPDEADEVEPPPLLAALMVMTNVALPDPGALIAEIVTLLTAAVVGVPEMRPVMVFTVKPEGRPVALKLVGVLLPVIW